MCLFVEFSLQSHQYVYRHSVALKTEPDRQKLWFVEDGRCEWLYCIWIYHLTLYRHSVALFELIAHLKKASNSVRIGRQLLIHVTVSRPRMQGFQWFTMCGGCVWYVCNGLQVIQHHFIWAFPQQFGSCCVPLWWGGSLMIWSILAMIW